MKSYDLEEEFFDDDKKASRKIRRRLQEKDRSKFKKTDQKKQQQPILSDLERGQITSITGEGIWVGLKDQVYLCTLKGALKKEQTRVKNLVAVGDFVRFSTLDQERGIIEQIEPRNSLLSRSDLSGKKEQLIAVNVDQVLIVTSLHSPPFKPALIDRYMIAAMKGHLTPIVVFNKIDLLENASQKERELYMEFLAVYRDLGVTILCVSAKTGVGIDDLTRHMQGKTSVFAGQSGVGKTSLLNLCFSLQRKVGDLAQKTHKGAHTTTRAELLAVPGGGYCVDTPGVRSFGLWQLTVEEIAEYFVDLHALAKDCKYPDCAHLQEPDCAVLAAVESNELSSLRYTSYCALMEEVKEQGKKSWS